MDKIKLKTRDGVVIEADVEIAKHLGTIGNLLQHFDILNNDEIVDLVEINSKVLKRMLDWADHHILHPSNHQSDNSDEIEEPVQRRLVDTITPWEKQFLKVDIETLFLYLRAANYLEIEDLRDIIVRIVANMLIGKSADEIRRKFHEIEQNKLSVI